MVDTGDYVIFHGIGGWPHQSKKAHQLLTVGEAYEVLEVDVGKFESRIYLKGFDQPFNSVMFTDENRCDHN